MRYLAWLIYRNRMAAHPFSKGDVGLCEGVLVGREIPFDTADLNALALWEGMYVWLGEKCFALTNGGGKAALDSYPFSCHTERGFYIAIG